MPYSDGPDDFCWFPGTFKPSLTWDKVSSENCSPDFEGFFLAFEIWILHFYMYSEILTIMQKIFNKPPFEIYYVPTHPDVQVNLCQKLSFLQNMVRTCCVQKLFWMSEKISVHYMFSPGLGLEFSFSELVEQSFVILWVSWCKNKSFWYWPNSLVCTDLN